MLHTRPPRLQAVLALSVASFVAGALSYGVYNRLAETRRTSLEQIALKAAVAKSLGLSEGSLELRRTAQGRELPLPELLEATVQSPRDDELRLMYGLTLYATGAEQDAIRLFKEVGSRGSDYSAEAQYLLGQAYIERREVRRAEVYLKDAAVLDPGNPKYAVVLANLAVIKGDTQYAEREYLAVLRRHRDYLPALVGLAGVHIYRGEWTLAAQHLRVALTLEPSAQIAVAMGLAEFKSGQSESAEAAALTALAIDYRSADAYHLLSAIKAHQGELEEAERLDSRARTIERTNK